MTKKIIIISLICCLLGLYFLVPRSSKKKKARCISDHKVFTELCTKAAHQEESFKQFKRDPFFTLFAENTSVDEGRVCLELIRSRYPDLLAHIDQFRQNDHLGNPVTVPYDIGTISPTTLHYMKVLGELRKEFGDLSNMRIIEIGGGYGGQCKIISDLFSFKNYTLVDLPETLELAQKYLNEQGVENVRFLTPDQLSKEEHYDLVLSTYGFSECNRSLQKSLFAQVLERSQRGYLDCNFCSKQFRVDPLSKNQLIETFKKRGFPFRILEEEPRRGKDNFILVWNHEI
ncbi:MAG TPA: putative sugar O-methyltransferase [Rhabdochlamydiaceae bacterium]